MIYSYFIIICLVIIIFIEIYFIIKKDKSNVSNVSNAFTDINTSYNIFNYIDDIQPNSLSDYNKLTANLDIFLVMMIL